MQSGVPILTIVQEIAKCTSGQGGLPALQAVEVDIESAPEPIHQLLHWEKLAEAKHYNGNIAMRSHARVSYSFP